MHLMILDKEETLPEELLKLQEEVNEVKEAILNNDTENTTEEVLDVIQVCVGMLYTLKKTKNVDIRKEFNKHTKKLVKRGWKDKGIVLVQAIRS